MKAILKEIRVKKVISIVLLILCCLFLIYEIDSMRYPLTYLYNVRYAERTSSDLAKKVLPLSVLESKADPTERDYSKLDKISGNNDDLISYYLRRPHTDYIRLKGSQTIRQTFVARDDKIKRLQLFFHNPGSTATAGRITVSVLDGSGNKICSSSLSAGLTLNDTLTAFDFTQDSTAVNANRVAGSKVSAKTSDGYSLKKGERYTIQIKGDGVRASSGSVFGIYLARGTYSGAELTVDGKSFGKTQLLCGVNYLHLSKTLLYFFFGCMLIALLLILLPLNHISEALRRRVKNEKWRERIDVNRAVSRLMFVITPFFCYWLVQKSDGKGLRTIFRLKNIFFDFDGLMTITILIMIMAIFYLIFNRTQIASLLTTFLTFAFCMANYFLILFRNDPLIATDFSSIGTAMDVAANYTISFSKRSLWLIVMTLVFLALVLSLKSVRGLRLRYRAVLLVACGLWGGWFYGVVLNTNFLNHHGVFVSGFNAKGGYHRHGSVVGFVYTVKNSRIEKPSGYSVNKVKSIASKYTSDTTDGSATVSKKTPNIIVIMDEAFADFSLVGNVQTSGDYLPFYHSLKKNTVKGVLYPSIFGGRTADTEFECLTGNSMQFYPLNAVPYNTNIRSKMPSLAYALEAQGYRGNIAFHPGVRTSYNRNRVYPLLGFEKYISQENLKDPEKIRAYISDEEDFRQIRRNYEAYREKGSSAPFFMFNVTIQNHSDFKLTSGYVEKEVTVTDGSLADEQTEQYVNLAKKTDEALKNLITYFRNTDEPTMIVLFGDHEPHVGATFYDTLKERMTGVSDVEKQLCKYKVPFMIWTNYDSDYASKITTYAASASGGSANGGTDGLQISANYIGPYILKLIDGKMTGYDKYLLSLQKKVPVTSAVAYMGDNGKFYSATAGSKYRKYLNQYHILQYNNTVDTKNRVNEFFYLKKKSKKK
ncbi:MAG: LTA synthase family protein [Clostridiales bacterium]|nr:LTA synthase family protein [Clostridiales bacterium]